MRVRTEWGTWRVSSCPRVSLSFSVTKAAMAARGTQARWPASGNGMSCFDK
jgi:hypothetical protein